MAREKVAGKYSWYSVYDRGEYVYLITDPESLKRQIVALQFNGESLVSYELAYGIERSWHDEVELTRTVPFG